MRRRVTWQEPREEEVQIVRLCSGGPARGLGSGGPSTYCISATQARRSRGPILNISYAPPALAIAIAYGEIWSVAHSGTLFWHHFTTFVRGNGTRDHFADEHER
jgi:hypothetical protein